MFLFSLNLNEDMGAYSVTGKTHLYQQVENQKEHVI